MWSSNRFFTGARSICTAQNRKYSCEDWPDEEKGRGMFITSPAMQCHCIQRWIHFLLKKVFPSRFSPEWRALFQQFYCSLKIDKNVQRLVLQSSPLGPPFLPKKIVKSSRQQTWGKWDLMDSEFCIYAIHVSVKFQSEASLEVRPTRLCRGSHSQRLVTT